MSYTGLRTVFGGGFPTHSICPEHQPVTLSPRDPYTTQGPTAPHCYYDDADDPP